MKPDLVDLIAGGGLLLLSIGLYMISPAAGFLVPGAVLLLVAIWMVINGTPPKSG